MAFGAEVAKIKILVICQFTVEGFEKFSYFFLPLFLLIIFLAPDIFMQGHRVAFSKSF